VITSDTSIHGSIAWKLAHQGGVWVAMKVQLSRRSSESEPLPVPISKWADKGITLQWGRSYAISGNMDLGIRQRVATGGRVNRVRCSGMTRHQGVCDLATDPPNKLDGVQQRVVYLLRGKLSGPSTRVAKTGPNPKRDKHSQGQSCVSCSICIRVQSNVPMFKQTINSTCILLFAMH
jgi:hypothetical protein